MNQLLAQLSAWLLEPPPAGGAASAGSAQSAAPRVQVVPADDAAAADPVAVGLPAGSPASADPVDEEAPGAYRFRVRAGAATTAFAAPVPVVLPGPALDRPVGGTGSSAMAVTSGDSSAPVSRRLGPAGGPRARRPRPADTPRAATSVCVVGTGAGAASLGQAVATRLARTHRPLPVVVATWAVGVPGAGRPASSAARRLAGTLTHLCEGAVSASGRLVLVALPEAADAAAADVAALVVRPEPCVVVLAGPRPPALEAVLGRHDLVVVATPADAPDGLADLAAAAITRASPGTRVHQAHVGGRRGRPSRALGTLVDELGGRA